MFEMNQDHLIRVRREFGSCIESEVEAESGFFE